MPPFLLTSTQAVSNHLQSILEGNRIFRRYIYTIGKVLVLKKWQMQTEKKNRIIFCVCD